MWMRIGSGAIAGGASAPQVPGPIKTTTTSAVCGRVRLSLACPAVDDVETAARFSAHFDPITLVPLCVSLRVGDEPLRCVVGLARCYR